MQVWTWTRLTPSRQAQPNGFGEQPAAVALPGEVGDQAEERQLALAGDAEIELEHADLASPSRDFEQLDRRMVDDRAQARVVA